MTNSATLHKRSTGVKRNDWALARHRVLLVLGWVMLYILLIFGALLFAAPLLWMITTALKPENQVYRVPVEWIPQTVVWTNFIEPWTILPFARFYGNTLLITAANVSGLLLSSSLVAFGFARIRFRGRNALFLLLLATMMLPDQVTLIPIYLFWSGWGLVNTYWPLLVPQWLSTGYNVFLLRQFFMSINTEYDDAARMDGAGWFTIYARILLPLSKPALGVVGIQAFAWNWNNFMDPLIYLNETTKYTISIGLRLFQTAESNQVAMVMAMTLLSLLPILLVFYVAQARFVRGIVISGVKG